jgi:hypothetical protein
LVPGAQPTCDSGWRDEARNLKEGAGVPEGAAAGWFRQTLKEGRSSREDEPFAKANGDGGVAKNPKGRRGNPGGRKGSAEANTALVHRISRL